MVDESVSYKPLYLQVKDVILQRILDDEYRKGATIPSEASMAQELGTSISTVRQALALLAEEGVLTKKQGKGTFVTEQTTTLSFLTWLPETKRGAEILAATLALLHEKQPALQVQCLPTTRETAQRDLLQRIASGCAPDLAQIQASWTGFFAALGALERLEPLLAPENLAQRFYDKDLWGGMYRNAVYSAAWGLSPVALLANKAMLRYAELEIGAQPLTLAALQTLCKRLEKRWGRWPKYSYGFSLTTGSAADFFSLAPLFQAFQGGIMNARGELIFDSAENIAALRWLRHFVQTRRVLIADPVTLRQRFAKHEIALIAASPSVKYLLEEETGEAFAAHFQVVLNPVLPRFQTLAWNDNTALAICAQSRHKLYAAHVIDALTQDEIISHYYYTQTGALPVAKTRLPDAPEQTELWHLYQTQLASATCLNAQHERFGQALTFCLDAVKRILFEGVDIETELHEKTRSLQLLLAA